MTTEYQYIGGTYKVSIHKGEYDSFVYPSDIFVPKKETYYKIGYEKLGKRKMVVCRTKKQLHKILNELKVEVLV